jgi:hypothetical protein
MCLWVQCTLPRPLTWPDRTRAQLRWVQPLVVRLWSLLCVALCCLACPAVARSAGAWARVLAAAARRAAWRWPLKDWRPCRRGVFVLLLVTLALPRHDRCRVR